jgi:hypothetical protein
VRCSHFHAADTETTKLFRNNSPLSHGAIYLIDELWTEHSNGNYGFSIRVKYFRADEFEKAILEESEFGQFSNEFYGANLVFKGYDYDYRARGCMPTVFDEYSELIRKLFPS